MKEEFSVSEKSRIHPILVFSHLSRAGVKRARARGRSSLDGSGASVPVNRAKLALLKTRGGKPQTDAY